MNDGVVRDEAGRSRAPVTSAAGPMARGGAGRALTVLRHTRAVVVD